MGLCGGVISLRYRVARQLGNRLDRRTREIPYAVLAMHRRRHRRQYARRHDFVRYRARFSCQAGKKAFTWLQRYGEWMLLLSWVPLIGDAFCVAAGWLRINLWLTLLMLGIGKCARYLAIAAAWAWVAA